MHKPKKTKCSVLGLVIAGTIFSFVGLTLILHPVPYSSMGATGAWGRTPVLSVFSGNDSAYIGLLILFLGVFVLVASYKIKKS
jgi:uncharacterized membrane protein